MTRALIRRLIDQDPCRHRPSGRDNAMRIRTVALAAFVVLLTAHAEARRGRRRGGGDEQGGGSGEQGGGSGEQGGGSGKQADHRLEIVTFPEEVTSVDSNMNKEALLYHPLKKTECKMPLIVLLHGAGGTKKKGATAFKGNRDVKWTMTPANSKYVAKILVPHSRSHWNPKALNKAVDHLLGKYSEIDKDRVYCIGFSLGGLGTWNWARHSPERLAAIVPVAFIANQDDLKKMVKLPIWAMAGTRDRKRVGSVRAMEKALKELGSTVVRMTIFEGANHFATGAKAWAQEGLLEWLFAQSLKNRK